MIARRLSHAYGGYAGAVALRRVGYGLFYLLGDHLGSTSVLVNQDGTLAMYEYYWQPRRCAQPADRQALHRAVAIYVVEVVEILTIPVSLRTAA